MKEGQSCDMCKWRSRTHCRKTKDHIMPNEWCSVWEKKIREKSIVAQKSIKVSYKGDRYESKA